MTMAPTIKNNNVFSSNYDKNVDWQINQLHRAICLYAEDYKIKKKTLQIHIKVKRIEIDATISSQTIRKDNI